MEKTLAAQYTSGLFPPKFHVLRYFLDDSQRFECFSLIDTGPFEPSNVLIKKYYRIMTPRFWTRTHETAENTSSALNKVQRPGNGIREDDVSSFLLNKNISARRAVGNTSCVMGCASYWDKSPRELRVQKQLWQLDARLLGCWVRCSVESGRRHVQTA